MYKSLGWFCLTSVCLKTCFAFSCGHQWKLALTIKILQAIWTWRHAFWGSTSVFLLCHIGKACVCFFFFHHWGLCFLGGHNYSLSRQNGGLIWGFPKWLKRCMGVVTSHCVSLDFLGSKKCVSFFFHFCRVLRKPRAENILLTRPKRASYRRFWKDAVLSCWSKVRLRSIYCSLSSLKLTSHISQDILRFSDSCCWFFPVWQTSTNNNMDKRWWRD